MLIDHLHLMSNFTQCAHLMVIKFLTLPQVDFLALDVNSPPPPQFPDKVTSIWLERLIYRQHSQLSVETSMSFISCTLEVICLALFHANCIQWWNV